MVPSLGWLEHANYIPRRRQKPSVCYSSSHTLCAKRPHARVAELADATVSKTVGETRAGSSPASGTILRAATLIPLPTHVESSTYALSMWRHWRDMGLARLRFAAIGGPRGFRLRIATVGGFFSPCKASSPPTDRILKQYPDPTLQWREILTFPSSQPSNGREC